MIKDLGKILQEKFKEMLDDPEIKEKAFRYLGDFYNKPLIRDMESKIRNAKKVCLSYHWHECKKLQKCHSIQKQKLKNLANGQNIISTLKSHQIGRSKNWYTEISYHKASVFKGFCNKQDSELFKNADKEEIEINYETIKELVYRNIAYHLIQKQNEYTTIWIYREVLKVIYNANFQEFQNIIPKKEIKQIFEIFKSHSKNKQLYNNNKLLLSFLFMGQIVAKSYRHIVSFFITKIHQYKNWNIKYIIWEVEKVDFAFSSFIIPNDGTTKIRENNPYIFTMTIPSKGKTFLMYCWFEEHEDELNNRTALPFQYMLQKNFDLSEWWSYLALTHVQNLFFNKVYWNTFSESEKIKLRNDWIKPDLLPGQQYNFIKNIKLIRLYSNVKK